MKIISHTTKSIRDKRTSLVALFLLAVPLAAGAQVAVFTDSFGSSTTNHTSTPGGTPSASSTSYDIASTKAATGGASGPLIRSGDFRVSLNSATGSGFVEAQAVFAATPVTLATVGDYINLTYAFTNTGGTILNGTASYIFTGLYNSGGSVPVAGGLANSGLNTTPGSAYASGNCANWQGYVSRISSGGTSQAYTRPIQNPLTGTTSANQDLIGNGIGGGAYTNLSGVAFDANETASVTLVSGAVYTNSYTIALTAVGTLTVTNNLFDSTGALIFSQTNTTSGSTNLTQAFDGLCIGVRYNGSTSVNPTMDITKIAITKSIFGSPGPSFDVTGSSNACPGTPYPVYLSGSVTTNVYFLFTNGVYDGAVAPQTGNGLGLTFGPITVVGTNTVLASNTVSSYTGLMSGSAVFAVLPGPTITAQPASATVASGYAAIFTVAATGGGLTYQWFTNGVPLADGGNISGSQSNVLTIFPATTTVPLARGYYVVISNPCGLTTNSITNSLTLGTPGNLFWIGNNPNTNWDLAATANWATSSGGAASTRFNSGDNVTFDDNSTYPVVTLVGSVDPTSINESSGQNYTFIGSGSIFGPGSLVMNGSGTLTISNANSYTGGTTINSGVVDIKNSAQQALGTGPVTLAGGKLEIGLASGSATTGLSNLYVSASSTLQLDVAGTYSFVVLNVLTGAPSATLTIQNPLNNSTTSSRMRLYGIFTNNAPISLATAGNMLEFAPYNPTNGNQVYNGLISGTGGRINVRSAGSVIFTNANTFNDSGVLANGSGPAYGNGPSSGLYGYSVLISGGTLGVGGDSSPDFAAYVPGGSSASGSSPLGTGVFGINMGPTEGGNATLFAYGGAHTIANPILYTTAATNYVLTINGSNNLTLSGTINLSGTDGTGGTNRIIQVSNTGLTMLSGVISDLTNSLSSVCGITKTGANALYLDANNTYTGSTVITNGMLAGIGTIAGPVVVYSAGTIAGGDAASIGTLTINNNLTLGGNALFKVNKAVSPSNDVVTVSGALTNSATGTLTVSNLGPSLVAGDRFVVFSEAVSNGAAMTITGAGVTWTNHLALDGSIIAGPAAVVATDLAIGETGPATVYPATNYTYTIMVSNLGPASASSVVVTDTLPANVTFVGASGGGANASGAVNWTIGGLNSGQISNVTLTVTAPTYGSVTNKAVVSSATTDTNPNNNTNAPIVTLVGPNPSQPHLTNSLSGNSLTLQWPVDHTGFTLQSQTNALSTGLGNNWVNFGGSSTTNKVIIQLDVTKGSVFYRLVYTP